MTTASFTNRTAAQRDSRDFGEMRRCGLIASIGLFALAVGVLVYLTDRTPHASILPSLRRGAPGVFGVLGLWLPSFVHPLAFGLFTAAVLPARPGLQYAACAFWCVVDVAFELGQHPGVSAQLAAAIDHGLGSLQFAARLANYFRLGTFDWGDIAAVVLGALAAAVVVCLMSQSRQS
jgi:hypothetical protein